MRIIECNIDKFGVISNQKFTFNASLNCIIADNGTGKTSLCSFIKAMLYGIGDTKRVSLDENDRKRYLPWSGGNARGSMTFFANDKTYRVERTFGTKASEDTFALYDVERGTLSSDFSELLGEELFGIDRDGYEETVYLSERGLSPTGANKSVSAKLSDLVGADGDIGGMDAALKILENQRKFLFKKGGGGAIGDAKRELMEKQAELTSLDSLGAEISKDEERLVEIEKSLSEIKRLRDDAASARAELEKQRIYVELEAKCVELQAEIEKEILEKEKIAASFGGKIPEREHIDTLKLDYSEAQRLLSISKLQGEGADSASPLKELFSNKSAAEDMSNLAEAKRRYAEIKRLKSTDEYQSLKSTFVKRIPKESECEAHITALEQTARPPKYALPALLTHGALCVLSILLGAVINPLFYALGAVLVLALGFSAFAIIKKHKTEAALSLSEARELIESVMGDAPNDRRDLISEILRIKSLVARANLVLVGNGDECETVIREIAYKYRRECADCEECASRLIADYESYKLLLVRESVRLDGARDGKRRADELISGIKEALGKFGIEFIGSFSEIYASIDRYRELSRSVTAKREECAMYRSRSPLGEVSGAKIKESVEIDIGELDRREMALQSEAGAVRSRIMALQKRLDEREAIEAECERLKVKLDEYLENQAVINKTRELLILAKDNIQSKYLGKTERSFDSYMKKISGKLGDEYRLDTDFNVTKSEGGISRPAVAYSRGTRELYILASRLALIDSLYEGESPFIILDDPFAYFDDERMKGAKDVLNTLSHDRQIIYLTCAKSRCV